MEATLLQLLLQIFTSFGFQGLLFVIMAFVIIKHSDKLFNSGKKLLEKRKYRADNSLRINNILQAISEELNADKIAVFEFHNGGSNLTGLPFLHFSLTQLRGKLGIPEFNKDFENQQRASAIDFFRDLKDEIILHINGAKDIEHTFPALAKQFEAEHIQYAVALNLEGFADTIGFLIIAFGDRSEKLTHEEECFVIRENNKIATLLDLKNYKQ